MRKTLILAAIAALAFTSAADAKSCKDAKGKFIKCPAAAAAPAKPMASPMVKAKGKGKETTAAPAMASMASAGKKAPHCVKGKACGNSCIKMTDVCHK